VLCFLLPGARGGVVHLMLMDTSGPGVLQDACHVYLYVESLLGRFSFHLGR
jgi:hypothetical protein